MSNLLRTFSPLRWRWLGPAIALVVLFHLSPISRDIDYGLFDLASRHPLRAPAPPPPSALVLVDDATLEALGRTGVRWPFPRSYFARLCLALHQAGAAKILLDFTFFEESGAAEHDLLLALTATAAGTIHLARTPGRPPFFWSEDYARAHGLEVPAHRQGTVEYPVDDDGVVRRYAARGSLAATGLAAPSVPAGGLLRWHGGLEDLRRKGVAVLAAAEAIRAGGPILERLAAAAPDLDAKGFAAALAREPPLTGPLADAVRGRVVFVGANAHGTFDLKDFPVGKLEPGLLLHWTAWSNLAAGGFIVPLPRAVGLGLALLAGAVVLYAGRRGLDVAAPAIAAAALGGGAFLGAYAGLAAGWFVPPATILVAALAALLGVMAETFWREQARKREIQSMFGAYVAPAVVAQLVRDPGAIRLGGERRDATVFFSDLAGFTELSEHLRDQPERMVEIVNAYLEETSECLLNHGAYVDKYIGDAVMAVFGVPQPLPEHALAACRAALGAQQLMAGINARYAQSAGVTLAVRIGVNTGGMIVGNLGSSRKKNYTVMGDTVNLASRLEGANKAFGTGILLGPETARAVAGMLAVRPLARLRVKGKEEAVEVFTLHGEPDKLPAEERAFLAAYAAGYASLQARRFAEAAEAFERADAILPGDLTTRRWRAEALRWREHPPPPDWEPRLALESK